MVSYTNQEIKIKYHPEAKQYTISFHDVVLCLTESEAMGLVFDLGIEISISRQRRVKQQ